MTSIRRAERTIGHYILTEEHDHRVDQEYAGFAESVRVAPGRYPIVEVAGNGSRPYLVVRLQGVTSHCFLGPSDAARERAAARVGKPATVNLQPYGYSVVNGAPAAYRWDGPTRTVVATWAVDERPSPECR
jgi:hypothetical protein